MSSPQPKKSNQGKELKVLISIQVVAWQAGQLASTTSLVSLPKDRCLPMTLESLNKSYNDKYINGILEICTYFLTGSCDDTNNFLFKGLKKIHGSIHIVNLEGTRLSSTN